MIDSSVRSLGEVEYDKQNWLQYRETRVRLNILNEVYHLFPLFINWSITKYFLTKTLLKMTDSTCPRFLMLESVLSEIVLIGNFFGMDCFRFLKRSNRRWTSAWIFSRTLVSRYCSQFCLSYSTSPRLLSLESMISKSVLIGNFFGMDRFRVL